MNFFWIYNLPEPLLAAIVVGLFMVLAVSGLLAMRRLRSSQSEDSRAGQNELVSNYVSAIGMFYGITVGLLAVGTWENYSNIDDALVEEASRINALYHDVSSYPEPNKSELRGLLQDFLAYELGPQWQAQKDGNGLPDGGYKLTAFQDGLLRFEPSTETEKIVHAETFAQFNRYSEIRLHRLAHVTAGLSVTLWYVVFIGGWVSIIMTYFFEYPCIRLHITMTALMSAFIGLLVFLIVDMDWPFRGDFSVSPEPLQMILDKMLDQ